MNTNPYSSFKIEKVFEDLETSPQGLLEKEAEKRIEKYGLNQIVKNQTHWWDIIIRQFKSSFIYLLLAAGILYFLMGQIIDGSMILLFVLVNVFLGFYQEYRSEQSLRLLKEYIAHKVKVRRGGEEKAIDSKLLAVGDIVILEAGDIIPADIRFFKENDLAIDESILTGESAPVAKTTSPLEKEFKEIYQAKNTGFSGSTVVSGEGEGVVFAIGKNMAIGKIANLTAEVSRESSFEKGINRISGFILRLIIFTLVFVLLANIVLKGESANIGSLIIFSIALAVSVIPEALPMVTTFSLSQGALRLAKNKVVVKRLSAIEDLGSIEVLCTDKTGTLTESKLILADIYSKSQKETMSYGSLAFSITEKRLKRMSNVFDLALFEKMTLEEKKKLDNYQKIKEIPFDPKRRRNSVLVKKDGNLEIVVRGSYENIISFSKNIDEAEKEKIEKWAMEEGRKGRRVIAVAKKSITDEKQYSIPKEEDNLDFIGLLSFENPIKKTTEGAIKKAKKLGVRIKILTGDSPEVAGAVAYQIGLTDSPDEVMTGGKLFGLNFKSQREMAEKYAVFARVSPEQKYNIIQLLEEKNEVGFLGEGINDAPALKVANVGLVVQGAADIAREAADIVLLNKSLEVIIDGIKEGRSTFTNTIKYIKATLASNFGNFYAVAIASMIIDFLPMLPLQILLVNLLSDFPMVSIATDTVDEEELAKPKSYNIKEIALIATVLGIVSSVFDFMVFSFFYKLGPEILQTNWFIASILTELVFLFSIRTKGAFFKGKIPSASVVFLTIVAALATVIIPFTEFGQKVFKFTRPSLDHLFLIFTIVIVYFVITESVKLLYYRYENSK